MFDIKRVQEKHEENQQILDEKLCYATHLRVTLDNLEPEIVQCLRRDRQYKQLLSLSSN